MKYKVVPGPRAVEVKQGKEDRAFDVFQQIINREAQDGWVYHSMEDIRVDSKSGCLNVQISTLHYYMLVFVKDDGEKYV